MASERAHDIVLFGATGFTGGLTAEYLARNLPEGTTLALAGRNRAKLEAVRDRLVAIDARHADVPLLLADSGDAGSLKEIAESARVLITTVGPYALHGEPLVAACAAAGTDYLDLTGEPEFVDKMFLAYHEQAEKSGARIVHCAGFDSIPHDLGAYFTVKQLPEGVPIKVEGFFTASGEFSGGTLASAVNGFASVRETLRAAKERKAREQQPAGRRVRGIRGGVRREPVVDGWVAPAPTIDPQIITRSAKALDRYGPDFSYGHYLRVKHLPTLAAVAGGLGAVAALAQLPPTRKALLKIRGSGDGPSQEKREKSWFRVTFIGEGGGERVVTAVSGGDPGYTETAKMLAESGLCLACDDLPERSGQLTPMVAMGEALLARLQAAGIKFEVVEGGTRAPESAPAGSPA